MTQAPAVVASSRGHGVVDTVDRLFPLAWIVLYLLLPASGWAPVFFDSWFDQMRDLEALRSVLADGRAAAIADNVVGPAYIALAAVVHWVFGLSPEDSLVALTRASYALSVAAALVLVRVLVRRLTDAPSVVTLASQLGLVALVFAAGTWYWSDVPWSHFLAAFLGVAFYATRFARAPGSAATWFAALTGVVVALLALTRSFELVALLAAWAATLVLVAVLRLARPSIRPAALVAGAAAFVVTTAVVYGVAGKRDVFFLYSNHLDRQSGAVLPAEVAETPTFSPTLVPIKLVQLFYEPCYYSLCTLSDYAGGTRPLPPNLADASGAERLWRLPLAVQLPTLVLLPLCLAACAGLVFWFARRRSVTTGRVRELRAVVEMTVAASVIVLGYSASTMTGSGHLRYGFARDFLLPALLTGVVAVGLASAGVWLLLSRREPTGRRLSSEARFVLAVVVGAGIAVTCVVLARSHGLPRIDSRQLESVTYAASCEGAECDVSLEATTPGGRRIAIPEASTLTFGCGDETPRFTLYVRDPTEGVRLQRSCRDPRLVAAWPTVMGLPPGRFELAAVDVVRAPTG